MSDPLAVWGAVTGTVATSVLVAHEFRARRVRVAVEHGVNLYMSRENPGEIISGWLLIRVWNRGGRDATVEQVGLAWLHSWQEGNVLHINTKPSRAHVPLSEPFQLVSGGPSKRAYTPLAGVLALGVDPITEPAWAWTKATDGRLWEGPMHPVIQLAPPGVTREQFRGFIERLHQDAEQVQPTPGLAVLPFEPPEYSES